MIRPIKNIYSHFSKFKFTYKDVPVLLIGNDQHRLASVIMKMILLVGGRNSPSSFWAISSVLRKIVRLYDYQGMTGVVKYTKTATVLIQQSISKYRVNDISGIGPRVSRTRSGLPRIIPYLWRMRIREGQVLFIRLSLTITNIYRVLDCRGKLSFDTITSLATVDLSKIGVLYPLIPKFTRYFRFNRINPKTIFSKIVPFEILKGASTSIPFSWSTGDVSLERAALMINANPLKETIFKFLQGSTSSWVIYYIKNTTSSVLQKWYPFNIQDIKPVTSIKPLGKLGLKQEAAGKWRVFAMVDPVTQWILRPLHRGLFRIIGRIPMDGTFDQLKPLKEAFSWPALYSFDLTAATDRLPIVLQVKILESVIGVKWAALWADLLVNRTYRYRTFHLRYAVGQPMGALSSWAMLAVTHHFIVQASAWRCGAIKKSLIFKDYALLGDDIVIGNKAVAQEYLKVMKLLGVRIGLAKSVISENGIGLEFAKRTMFKGEDVSPVPFKEFSEALVSIPSLLQLCLKYKAKEVVLVKILGYGYRVLGGLTKDFRWQNNTIKAIRVLGNLPTNLESFQAWIRLGMVNRIISDHQVFNILWQELNALNHRVLKEFYIFKNKTMRPVWRDNEFVKPLLDVKDIQWRKINQLVVDSSRALKISYRAYIYGSYITDVFTIYQSYLDLYKRLGSIVPPKPRVISNRDPRLVKVWKLWSKSLIHKPASDEQMFRESMFPLGLPIRIMFNTFRRFRPLILRRLPSFWGRVITRLPWIGFAYSVFRISTLIPGLTVITAFALILVGLETLVIDTYTYCVSIFPFIGLINLSLLLPKVATTWYSILIAFCWKVTGWVLPIIIMGWGVVYSLYEWVVVLGFFHPEANLEANLAQVTDFVTDVKEGLELGGRMIGGELEDFYAENRVPCLAVFFCVCIFSIWLGMPTPVNGFGNM